MKYIDLFGGHLPASQVALGGMRIAPMTDSEADAYLNTAADCGYNYFDHADIYGGGMCEEVFGKALKRTGLRDKILVQTKCGIRNRMYDFSKEHIIASAEASLKRLGIEQLDALLLHRPDLLMEPEEVAAAFDHLYNTGKVAHFGVSNHSPAQIELLKRAVKQPLIINQMQLSITAANMIASGATVNTSEPEAPDRDGYLRDYCRLNGITIQPWSPLQHGFIAGPFIGNEDYPELNNTLKQIAEAHGVTETGIAIAWLLRLPDGMQPIVGSTNLSRIREIAAAADITLSAREWYDIYLAAGYALP